MVTAAHSAIDLLLGQERHNRKLAEDYAKKIAEQARAVSPTSSDL
jgi:hypothetical protein